MPVDRQQTYLDRLLVGGEEDAVAASMESGRMARRSPWKACGHLPQPSLEADIGFSAGDGAHDLQAICAAAGFTKVETYIASGNVVFEAKVPAPKIRAALEKRPQASAESRSGSCCAPRRRRRPFCGRTRFPSPRRTAPSSSSWTRRPRPRRSKASAAERTNVCKFVRTRESFNRKLPFRADRSDHIQR
jgi:uncharacterized protein DUF1697